jgi:hypothetical protein
MIEYFSGLSSNEDGNPRQKDFYVRDYAAYPAEAVLFERITARQRLPGDRGLFY